MWMTGKLCDYFPEKKWIMWKLWRSIATNRFTGIKVWIFLKFPRTIVSGFIISVPSILKLLRRGIFLHNNNSNIILTRRRDYNFEGFKWYNISMLCKYNKTILVCSQFWNFIAVCIERNIAKKNNFKNIEDTLIKEH